MKMENPKYQAENPNASKHEAVIKQAMEAQQASHPGFGTRCVHAGQPPEPIHGSVNVPIHLTSTYAQKAPAKPFGKFDYTRCGNPTSDALNDLLSALEYGQYSWTFSSGCGATSCLFSLWSQGDHVLLCDDVYGGTNRLANKIFAARFGLDIEMVDMTDIELLKSKIRDNTRMIWIETPTNPTLKLIDIEAVCEVAQAADHKILTVVDNTFATPYNQSPLKLGADVAYNSLTKYIAGHSDTVAGSITVNEKELYDRIFFNAKSIGTNISPFDSYLILRGAKTLALRMERVNTTSLAVAMFLLSHPNVEKVSHPGLTSHPQYELAQRQMRGCSGMCTFWIKGGEPAALKFFEKVKVFLLAESLGGVESLCEYPYVMTHASVPPEQRLQLGIDDSLIRLSCGVEDPCDLIEDLRQALE